MLRNIITKELIRDFLKTKEIFQITTAPIERKHFSWTIVERPNIKWQMEDIFRQMTERAIRIDQTESKQKKTIGAWGAGAGAPFAAPQRRHLRQVLISLLSLCLLQLLV